MFKKVLYSIVIIVFLFFATGFFLPREVHVERQIDIDRPAPTVFALVNGYATFNSWSPWAARDPSARYVFSGPAQGVGARMEWSGDPRLSGKGSQEIIESRPFTRVRTRLDFGDEGEAVSYFDLAERTGGTRVTWGFDSDLTAGQTLVAGIIARYFGLFFDRWVGGDYAQGLANLKAFAEALPNVDISGLEVEILQVEPVDILYIETGSSQDPGDIANALAGAFQEIMDYIHAQGLATAAQPMAITRAGEQKGYAFDAAVPVVPADVAPAGNVKAGQSPAGRAIRVIHRGAYDRMIPTYEKLSAYMAAHGLREGPVSWEQYISDPGVTPEDELVTHIYYLLED